MRYPIMNLHRIGGMLEDYQKENDAFKEKLSKLNREAEQKWAQEHPGPVHHPPMFPSYPPFSEPPTEAAPYGRVVDFGPPPRPPLPPTLPGISVATGVPSRQPPLVAPPPPSYPPPPPINPPVASVDPWRPPMAPLPPRLPPPLPGISVATGVPSRQPPLVAPPPPSYPPPAPVNPPVPSVDRWFPPVPTTAGVPATIPTTQTPATTGLVPPTPIPGTPPPVASTACPPGQFWDGRQCRGSIGPMPGGIPGGESQGAATGVLNTGAPGNFSMVGRLFLGMVKLLPVPGAFSAPRLTSPGRPMGLSR